MLIFSRRLLCSAKTFTFSSSSSLSPTSTLIPTFRLFHTSPTNNMPATIIKVPVIEDIHRAINKAVDDHKDKDVFVYFYASIDPATGKSWCPDCVTAGPIVEEYFSKIDNAVLVDAPVGDRPKWKDPNHFLRHDSVVKITAVPTLVHWSTKSQLVENDCEDLAKLDKFVKRA